MHGSEAIVQQVSIKPPLWFPQMFVDVDIESVVIACRQATDRVNDGKWKALGALKLSVNCELLQLMIFIVKSHLEHSQQLST